MVDLVVEWLSKAQPPKRIRTPAAFGYGTYPSASRSLLAFQQM